MTPHLCHTFLKLANDTHDRLKAARSVGHQLLEETITGLNILELMGRRIIGLLIDFGSPVGSSSN